MILHGFAGSPNTWKVRALADHIGTPLQFKQINAAVREQKQPAYLELNPTGRTPVLVDGDFKLWESTAIMQYLATKAGSDLWPSAPRAQADVLRWQSWQIAHWSMACEPLIRERIVKKIFDMGPGDDSVIARANEVFDVEGRVLDAHLAGKSYLVSDQLSLADFSVASYLIHATAAELPLAPFPNLRSWMARVLSLPCWANTAPKPRG